MKNLLNIFGFVLVLSSFIIPQPNQSLTLKPISHPFSSAATYSSAVKLSPTEFQTLTETFQAANPETTYGGLIDKSSLKKMITDMPAGEKFLNFKFCTDNGTSQVSLMVMGGSSWVDGVHKTECLRNGKTKASFCPTSCDLNSTDDNTTILLAYTDFDQLADAYQAANPGVTLGGNIDKSAVQELISSLPNEAAAIAFRFVYDPTYKQTSVVFVGGNVGQPNATVLYYRNGKSVDSFCPNTCGIRE